MNEGLAAELTQLRRIFPDAELRDDLWARIPAYRIDEDRWGLSFIEVAFRWVLPGQPPYAFWVRPGLTLNSGVTIQNYTPSVETPFGPGWGQFSWSPSNWTPADDARPGGMLRWARSFAERLAEGA